MKKSNGPANSTLDKPFWIALLLIFGLGTFYFLQWPISGRGDTDLWYHLNGGRYLFTHHRIPTSGFFSFIAEQREWTNYYWFFQALVYAIHKAFDFNGLIIFRALVYLLTLGLIWTFFLKDREKDSGLTALLCTGYFICLIPRYFATIRPHMLSYLFIILFLLLIERRRALLALPLLAILWANSHGVEYPVMMLICGAYLVEAGFKRLKQKTPLAGPEITYAASLVLSLWAVLLNPFGPDLLYSPFQSAPFQYEYIKELRHINPTDFLSFSFWPVDSAFDAISNLILLIALLSCFKGLVDRDIRISHLILMIGGLYLLTRAYRFRYEAVLLALPVLAHTVQVRLADKAAFSKFIRIGGAVVLVVVSFVFLGRTFANRPHHPASTADLPAGSVAFLNQVRGGGRILNLPDDGGYLQWSLGRDYKIFMDLEMMLFTDTDIFRAARAFLDEDSFKNFCRVYRPAFILPHIRNSRFHQFIQNSPRYVPVFFDDKCVLYADSDQHPELTKEYRLRHIDPARLSTLEIAQPGGQEKESLMAELLRLYKIFPEGALINQILAQYFFTATAYDKALAHAETAIENHPENATGYFLKADVLTIQADLKQAEICYKKGLSRSREASEQLEIRRKLWQLYSGQGQHRQAYAVLKKVVRIFSPASAPMDIYRLGTSALALGRLQEGVRLLEFASIKAPDKAIDLKRKIRARLLRLTGPENIAGPATAE